MASRLDIIVFGATGFTGKFTLPQVHKLTASDGRNLTWGVAGRSEQKLKSVLSETAKRIGVNDLSLVPTIVADVGDEDSIKKMTSRAKVIINCCGPYMLYGEVVVKACIETRTHYVDVTGEPQFIENMELKFHKAAMENGVYIVNACGYDCVASDLGVMFLKNKFKGTLNSVEIYAHTTNNKSVSGSKINYGSWMSIVHALDYKSLFAQSKKLSSNSLPAFQPKLKLKYPVHKIENKWAIPLLLADNNVVQRSQLYFYEHHHTRPIQMHFYAVLDSLLYVLVAFLCGFIFFILAQFEYGRRLLLKYPRLLTNGLVSTESPTDDAIQHQQFSLTFYGKGWTEKLTDCKDQYKTAPNKMIVGRISGVNPGYGFTCIAVTLSAIMILTEPKLLPAKGGVYTPAIAFGNTSFISELEKNGTVFEIVSIKDI